MTYHIGQKLKGRITGIQPYGAFVMLDDHTQGLIHISECRSGVVHDLNHELQIGEEVVVTVLDIEQYTNKTTTLPKKISLRKHFWTNNHLNYGFAPNAAHRDEWIAEALARIDQ